MTEAGDFIVGKAVGHHPDEPNLRTGEQFRESLRDGRRVILGGREVEDVTAEPSLAGGIDTFARLLDAQLDPKHRDITTAIEPETGERIATGWLVPYTKADLWRHDAMSKLSTYQTFGVFGRPPDYGPVKAIAFLAFRHLIEKAEPEIAEKARHLIRVGQKNNLVSADIIVDVQTDRRKPMPEQAGRLRVVEEREHGVVLYGAKAGNSYLAQGNIGSISMPPPNPTMPAECAIWSAVPANAPGLTIISREPVITGDEDPEDHPLDARGEENDSIIFMDHVFVPGQYVFSYRNPAVSQAYNTLGRVSFWKIATRMSYRAEIFAGAAKMIASVLGTDHIPAVRALVAEVGAYAATLRALMIAAIETASLTESGVMLPSHAYVTACRLHANVGYPKIMQILRELSGQGLISRVPRATWERADLGPVLDEFLPGHGVTAREKNRFFNLIWDMTSSAAAMRIALFENINATPAATIRQVLYDVYDSSEGAELVKRLAGIEA